MKTSEDRNREIKTFLIHIAARIIQVEDTEVIEFIEEGIGRILTLIDEEDGIMHILGVGVGEEVYRLEGKKKDRIEQREQQAENSSITIEQAIKQLWDKLELMDDKLDRVLENQKNGCILDE